MPTRNSVNNVEAQLASWVHDQRSARLKSRLSEERSSVLEHLPAWSWQPRKTQWEAWYQLAWSWFFGPPCSLEAPRAFYPRSSTYRSRLFSSDVLEDGDTYQPEPSDVLEDGDTDQPESSLLHDESPSRPLALWLLRQREAYRRGRMSTSRSERLQALPRWTWTRVRGEIESQPQWEHHFKLFVELLKAGPCPTSAYKQRLFDWLYDSDTQFNNAVIGTETAPPRDRIKLAPRKSFVPVTWEERYHWKPTSILNQWERLHWVVTLPSLLGEGRTWDTVDAVLRGCLCRPEKDRQPLRPRALYPWKEGCHPLSVYDPPFPPPHRDLQGWGPGYTAFFNRIDPSILSPRNSEYVRVPAPLMPWERMGLFMRLKREYRFGWCHFPRLCAKARELFLEVESGLIAQRVHKRGGSMVGCLAVSQSCMFVEHFLLSVVAGTRLTILYAQKESGDASDKIILLSCQ